MLLVFADHPHHTAAMDDLALIANLLYRCPNLHKDPAPSRQPLASFSDLRRNPAHGMDAANS